MFARDKGWLVDVSRDERATCVYKFLSISGRNCAEGINVIIFHHGMLAKAISVDCKIGECLENWQCRSVEFRGDHQLVNSESCRLVNPMVNPTRLQDDSSLSHR